MLVDATTLTDLEVFQDGEGRGGIFALLDATQTARGRRALRRRLESPPHDVRTIRHAQEGVAFFLQRSEPFHLVAPGSTEAAERHLSTNIHIGAGLGDRLRLALRYRDLLAELRDGVLATEAWLRRMDATARALLAADPPHLVASLARSIREDVAALPLASGSRSVRTVLALDQAYRFSGRARVERILSSLAELDCLQSMAVATRRHGWSMPEIVEQGHFLFEAEGLVHPFVEDPVANPIDLTGGEPMVFLTGPNMAGKTTYLRAAALAVLLAQCGSGVPATRMRLSPVEVLLSSLSPADNLRAGLSFFQSEVLRVRDAAAHLAAGRRSFVLFDEVFKGTNVNDALEASATVIAGFAKARGSGFVFSSHLVELVDSLQAVPEVRFCCFDGRIIDGHAEYSYRMKAGVSDQRFGLQLLGEARIPELLRQIAVG